MLLPRVEFKRPSQDWVALGQSLLESAVKVVEDHAPLSNGIHAQVPMSRLRSLADAINAMSAIPAVDDRSDLMVRLDNGPDGLGDRFGRLEIDNG